MAKLTTYIRHGEDVAAGFAASAEVWGQHPAAVTVLQVAALGRPEALMGIDLVGIEAIAIV